MRPLALVLTLLALLLASCDSEPQGFGSPRLFRLGAVSLSLPAEPAWVRVEERSRVLLEHDGLLARVQVIPREGAGRERTAASVAEALATRFSLGEQPGRLAHGSCRFAAVEEARCMTGTFERDAASWVRRGSVIEAAGHVVWLDVVGPAARIDDVETWSEVLGRTAAVAGGA